MGWPGHLGGRLGGALVTVGAFQDSGVPVIRESSAAKQADAEVGSNIW